MFDGEQNITLQQINYQQSDIESLSGISQIIYEQDYNHFNDFSFNQDHLQLSKVNITPNINKCQISFYQQQPSTNPRLNNKKIATINSNGVNPIKQPIKLPNKNTSLFLQVASRQNILRGQLSKNTGNSSINLFDRQGKLKGNFNYHLAKKNRREEQLAPTLQLAEQNTLESKDFIEELSSIKREMQIIKNDKLTIQSRTTLKTQPEQHQIPRKKYQQIYQHKQVSDEDSSDSHSAKSQIDYMGYLPHETGNKASQYRLPLPSKHPPKLANKPIDYQSIQKSMRKLGISNKSKIQKMLGKKTNNQSSHFQPIQEQIRVQVAPLPSRHDFSSQVDQAKPNVAEFGIGTYTPIPSRQAQERQESLKPPKEQFSSRLNKNQSSHSLKGQQPKISQKRLPLYQQQEDATARKEDLSLHNKRYQSMNEQNLSDSKQSIIQRVVRNFQKQHQLSMRNKVYEIKLGEEKLSSRIRVSSRLKSEQSYSSKKVSRKQFQTYNKSEMLSQSEHQSALYPKFDLCVNNLSVNFHNKSFGTKYLQLSIAPTTYKTDQLGGNNLIWIGKSFLFKRVSGESELCLTIKKISAQNAEQYLGEVKIKVSDILLNKKKSYFQTFLLSKKSVLATVIVGFQIVYRNYLLHKQAYPLKVTRQSQAQTEFSKGKTTKIKRVSPKKRPAQKHSPKQQKLPQARINPIRMRKYLGGKNIKIGKASRFINEAQGIPGPGDYQIQSSFSRHAQKDY